MGDCGLVCPAEGLLLCFELPLRGCVEKTNVGGIRNFLYVYIYIYVYMYVCMYIFLRGF